ncbi:MAG: sigma-54-dependent transcriptional regulator [Bdellovibrionia bacterium]
MPRILLVDDDPQSLDSTRRILELEGMQVVTAQDGQAALEWVRPTRERKAEGFDLVISDVRMPRLSGLEFLKAASFFSDKIPVILMTAYGRVEDAVWAMKLGAVDFLTKPFKRQALLSAIEGALKRSSQRSLLDPGSSTPSLIGSSLVMEQLRQMIAQVAPTSAPVLLRGESGTGKERVAQLIHQQSARSAGPMIAINCSALPENLIESELFGFERGAFTGATTAKEGLFEAAHGGTLLLDEIGDMPLSLQAKLLRVLQENEVRRLGSTYSRKIDVRVIAASHRNLKEKVKEGSFREDLLYRLEVIEIQVPALRERLEDLSELASWFLSQANAKHGKSVRTMDPSVLEVFQRHSWPGNVRELSNIMERAVIFAQTDTLSLSELPAHLTLFAEAGSGSQEASLLSNSSICVPLGTTLQDVEDLLIRKTLEATAGDKNMTAKLLGINSRTIYRKLDKRP